MEKIKLFKITGIIILLIIIIISLIYVYRNGSIEKESNNSEETISQQPFALDEVNPKELVKKFYEAYVNFHLDPNPQTNQLYNYVLNNVLSRSFKEKLDSFMGYDPIMCAQDIPIYWDFEEIENKEGFAKVKVKRRLQFSSEREILVLLEKNNNVWIINDIQCLPDKNSEPVG